MAKADINCEKELWEAPNELRGAVSENNYKNYIPPLVFVKQFSGPFEVVREELKEQLNDPNFNYYTINKEETITSWNTGMNTLLEIPFKIPETPSFQLLNDNAEQDNTKVKVDDAFNVFRAEQVIVLFIPIKKCKLRRKPALSTRNF